MNRSSQNSSQQRDPQIASQQDLKIDAALKALNSVQPAARFEQRVHARLAQVQEANAAGSAWSNSLEKLAGLFTWPRAAFALATFTAGVLAATLGLPMLHRAPVAPVEPFVTDRGAPTATPTNPAATIATKPDAVHPGFTVRTPDGRAAALNTVGTVATVRSRNAHSDTQLAARQGDHVHARLTKPVRPKAGQPAAATADDQPSVMTPASSPEKATPQGDAAAPPNN